MAQGASPDPPPGGDPPARPAKPGAAARPAAPEPADDVNVAASGEPAIAGRNSGRASDDSRRSET